MTSRTEDVRPFPYSALEALTAGDVAGGARLRRFARAHVDGDAIARALAELVGESVQLLPRRVRRMEPARSADDAIGIVLAPAGAREPARRVLVELEIALAASLTARALRQRAPRVADPSKPASPELAGAVAAVLAAALRTGARDAPRVVAAGPGHALIRDLAQAGDVTTMWLTVVVGPDAFSARISVPDAAVLGAPPPDFDLDALGDAPIALPLVAFRTLASRRELGILAPGDAFVPAGAALRADATGALTGPVFLAAAGSERAIGGELAEGGRLVVRGLETSPWDAPMPEDPTRTAVALEDAPVVVRVELGSVEMKAREWAALGAGDVVTLGRRIGDLAILRVGGVEVARGELVQVDGEYAVRIVSREGSRT